MDIVLIRTDVHRHYGEPGYEDMHPGMTREATLWLIEHGIKVMGIDAWGWDRPHDVMIADLKAGKKRVLGVASPRERAGVLSDRAPGQPGQNTQAIRL